MRSALPSWMRSGRVVAGLVLFALMVAIALGAPLLAPHDPNEQDLLSTHLPPAWAAGGQAVYPLGTDSLGRCTLSRLLYGTRIALQVAVTASLGAAILGSFFAYLSGYFGRWTDLLVSRLVEIWMAFPPVVLALILMTCLGHGVQNVILAIILVDWTRFCRVLRSEVIVVARKDYVAAARLMGFSHLRTLVREVAPATIPLIIMLISLEMGIAVIVEAILSFVGMSVEANVPAWGQMIADARQDLFGSPWALVFPVGCIFVSVLTFNLLGDGLRTTLDIRLSATREAHA